VHFSDAEAVLYDPNALFFEDTTAQCEQRFVVIGLDYLWRLLVVIYTERGDHMTDFSSSSHSF
jgi:uncharacterized protein